MTGRCGTGEPERRRTPPMLRRSALCGSVSPSRRRSLSAGGSNVSRSAVTTSPPLPALSGAGRVSEGLEVCPWRIKLLTAAHRRKVVVRVRLGGLRRRAAFRRHGAGYASPNSCDRELDCVGNVSRVRFPPPSLSGKRAKECDKAACAGRKPAQECERRRAGAASARAASTTTGTR